MSANRLVQAFSVLALLGFLIFPAWSDSLPPVPVPQGFIESSSLVPALKTQALQGRSARTRLIGVYLLQPELAKVMHGSLQQLTIFCRAYVIDEFRTWDEAKEFFRGMIEIVKKRDQPRKFDLRDPDVSRIVQRYVNATKLPQEQFANLIGAAFLGSIFDTEDIYAVSMVVSSLAQTDKGQVFIPDTGAVAWMRWGNEILELSDVAQFEGVQSIELANGVLLEWLKAFALTNAAP